MSLGFLLAGSERRNPEFGGFGLDILSDLEATQMAQEFNFAKL